MARKWNPSFHPRDKRGRFTKSATRVMTNGDRSRGRKALEGFKPASFADHAAGRSYLEKVGKPASSHTVAGYFASDWRDINADLRAGHNPAGVDEIDKAMQPLPDDLVLRRQLPADMFAHIPLEDLVGMKVRDAAYSSTSLDVPGDGNANGVTMHIAAPKGTPAIINAPDGEILLGRDAEIAISRAEPNGSGGWDIYGTVLPKAKSRTKTAQPDASPGPNPDTEPGGEPTPHQPKPAALDDQIPDVIGGIIARDGSGPETLVSLARVRDELPDVDRADVDAALLRLDRARVIQLEPEPNRRALTDRAKAAAIPLGGDDMHLVALVNPTPAAPDDDHGPATPQDTLDAVSVDAMASPRPAAITHRMFRALSGYRDEGFTAVNSQLRGGAETPTVTRQIAAMDDAMQVSHLTRDVQLFRGLADARSMFGDRVDADLTGLRWREDAFVSTTAEPKVARRFAEDGLSGGTPMVMHIAAPQGTPAVGLSRVEAEVLVDRGHTLRVTRDLGVVDGIRVVEVELEPKAGEATS